MSAATVVTILEILVLAEQHGIPFIKSMINELNKDVITKADIVALQNIKPFSSFFPGLKDDK